MGGHGRQAQATGRWATFCQLALQPTALNQLACSRRSEGPPSWEGKEAARSRYATMAASLGGGPAGVPDAGGGIALSLP